MRKLNYLLVTLVSCVLWGCSEDDKKDVDTNYHFICPDSNHPHMIDLGLPSGTKWACCNIGANLPIESGIYVAWGETSEKEVYEWGTYLYGSDEYQLENIGSDIAGTQYDAAYANWGSPWHMPTHEQQLELLSYCSSLWISIEGVYGRKLKGPNGYSIFLPAAGMRWEDELSDFGEWGYFWSSSQSAYIGYEAFDLNFSIDAASYGRGRYTSSRKYGFNIRAVAQ